MNTGVELLLKRMETHPEEFIMRINHGTSQWGMLIQQFADHFDEEDHVALKAGIRKCHQEVFTGKVMQALAGEDEPSDEGKSLYNITHPSATGLAGVTQGLSTIQNQAYNNLTLGTNGAGQLAWSNTTATGTVTLPSGSITLGSTTLSEAGLIQMLATHRAMREETKPKHWWNKSIPELLGRK